MSPALSLTDTEDFKKALTQKKFERIKKELVDVDAENSVEEEDDEEDIESVGFSSSFSVFNKDPRGKIR